jgi:hypothetical protein
MDCVNQILDFYNRKTHEKGVDLNQFRKIWFSNLLIKLSQSVNGSKDSLQDLQNCLVLLINLFSDCEDPDYVHAKGKIVNQLDKEESNYYKELLKSEFVN